MLAHTASVLSRLVSHCECEEGQALAEYGLILALVVVASILALTALGVVIALQLGAIEAVFP